MELTHIDLFAGIGGGSLAADWVWPNMKHIFCEIDPFCQKVLKKHWPNSEIYADIKQFDGTKLSAYLVTGGFPCQPFSSAGQRKGKDDDRDLWPEMFRVIREVRPTWIVGENVANFVNMELERSLSDLESEGYEVQPFVIPACAVNAPHRRDRVWIIAHAAGAGDSREPQEIPGKNGGSERNHLPESRHATDLHDASAYSAGHDAQRRLQESEPSLFSPGTNPFLGAWETRKALLPEAVLCRADDGIPNRVDRTKALGNAWVPQVAYQIFKAIQEAEKNLTNPAS